MLCLRFASRTGGPVTRRFLLDTNILSDLVRHPHGRISDHIKRVGEQQVCTSIVVAAKLRYGASKKASARLTKQLEAILGVLDVRALEAPVDVVYGKLRAHLEQAGQSIGGNDLLIAAHALALDHTMVTDNEREFSWIEDLKVENWLR
jgi:tRNA(fMet)-specific endonuclease VapC